MNEKAEQFYWAKIKCSRFEDYINSIVDKKKSPKQCASMNFRETKTENSELLIMKLGIIERVLKQSGME